MSLANFWHVARRCLERQAGSGKRQIPAGRPDPGAAFHEARGCEAGQPRRFRAIFATISNKMLQYNQDYLQTPVSRISYYTL
jgi:hypothetical protein